MNDNINESELGRTKKSAAPSDHLEHLLNIGWAASSLLIRKYVAKFGLQDKLSQWQKNNEVLSTPTNNTKKVTKQ